MIVTGNYENVGEFEYVNRDECKIRFKYSFDDKSELFDIGEFRIEGTAFTLEHNITPNKINNQFIFVIFDYQSKSIGSIRLDVEKDEFYLNITSDSIKISKERESENNDEWNFGKH